MPETTSYNNTELSVNVRYGEVGPNGFISLKSLANLLQEAAGQSADILGFGEQAMAAYGLTWVLARLILRITRLPGAEQALNILTWPAKLDRFGYRGYEVRDQANALLVSGGSAWAIMNLATRRLAQPPADLTVNYPQNLRPCEPFSCRTLPGLNPTAEQESQVQWAKIIVRKDDLDINQHANNANYLSWLLEPLPLNQKYPSVIDITFRAECFPGNVLLSQCLLTPFDDTLNDKPAEQRIIHAIRRIDPVTGSMEEDVCRALTIWPA